jgi:hypothetical protein
MLPVEDEPLEVGDQPSLPKKRKKINTIVVKMGLG